MKLLKIILPTIFVLFLVSNMIIAQEEPDEIEKRQQEEQHLLQEHLMDTGYHEFSEEDEERYLKNFKAPMRKYLQAIKTYNKDRYREVLQDAYYTNVSFPFYNKRDKARHERSQQILQLEIGTEALGLQYQNDSDANKAQIKSELQDKLKNLFELREVDRREEVAMLEMQLEELRKSIDARAKNKNEIVSRRLQELTGESKYLDWD